MEDTKATMETKGPAKALGTPAPRKKIIIDSDPGIDDAMAILFALRSPELDVIGLTTIFGNVDIYKATDNAIHLLEFGGREDIPVCEGLWTTLRGCGKRPDWFHIFGNDGLGNTNPNYSGRQPDDRFAPDFLIQMVNEFPGEVTIVALGPLTNLAKAVEQDPTFAKKVGQIFILGGAFQGDSDVNPAAETNVVTDREAAAVVFTCGADIVVVGVDITHKIFWTGQDLVDLGASSSKYAKYISAVSQFYAKFHMEEYGKDDIFLHDPATMVAVVNPSLMTFETGSVKVQEDGITVFTKANKGSDASTNASGVRHVKVAVAVDNKRVASLLKERLLEEA